MLHAYVPRPRHEEARPMESSQKRALVLIEHLLTERERVTVRPQHPLESVRELHLEEAQGSARGRETRPSGCSRPPVRDMDRTANQVNQIMRHIAAVDERWRWALETVVRHGTLDAASTAVGAKRNRLYLLYREGLAAFQMEMFRVGL